MARLELALFLLLGLIAEIALGGELGGGMIPGRHDIALRHQGRERSYLVHIPPGRSPAAGWPVVLGFHGGGGNAEGFATQSELHQLGAVEGYVTVYPRGTGRFRFRLHTWNGGGGCCGYAWRKQVDDVGFVEALLDDLETRISVDARRVYSTGLSNGAIMSYRLAAELPHRIAAIAPVAAPNMVEVPARGRPVPIAHFHGTDDRNAPYEGGVGPRSISRLRFPSVRHGLEPWLRRNRVPATPRRTALPDRADDGQRVVLDLWGKGTRGEVRLYSVIHGGHNWPGGPSVLAWLLGKPTLDLSASREMWEFFQRHRLPPTGL